MTDSQLRQRDEFSVDSPESRAIPLAPTATVRLMSGRSSWQRWARLPRIGKDSSPPWVAFAFIVLLVLGAVFVPLLSPYTETGGSLSDRLLPPGGVGADGGMHLFGTDQMGRDVLVRLFYGARVSIIVGVVGVLVAAVFGTLVGLLAGTLGRAWDSVLMRITDVSLSIPGLLVAILLAAIFRPSIVTIFVVVGLLLWPTFARLIRGEVLALRMSDFVALSRVAGSSTATIMRRHLLPNLLPSVIVLATLQIGIAIIMEASISFLGVGLPPDQASWGSMVNGGRQLMTTAWWLTVVPGIGILLTVLSFNTVGDWARIRFDPRLGDAR